MSDVRINTRSPYYIEANPTAPEAEEIPDPIEENTPPTVTIVATNITPFVGESVTLTAVATDSDGTITNYLWGGGSSPEVTVSIDVTSSRVLSRTYYVIVTDDDGDTANASITINWQEIPSLTENEPLDVNCGDIVNEGSFVGIKTYNLVGVGDKVGTVEIEFLDSGGNQDVPVKFDITWNGTTQTTGYIGDAESGGSDPIPSPDNTASPTNKKNPTTLTINKTSSAPTQVTLTADPLYSNDTYKFKLNCPDTEATKTFFHTLTGTCTSGDTTFTYTDVNGVNKDVTLANGQVELVSAQDGTVVTSVCTGDTEKGGESFDLGVPEQDYDEKTELNILFDDSGSMTGTLQPLLDMANGILKDKLLSFYGGDIVKYNERVNLIKLSDFNKQYTGLVDFGSNTTERFLKHASYGKINPQSTKTIYMIFMDEVTGPYFTVSQGQTGHYPSDLSSYRSYLDSIPYGEHFMKMFIVEATKQSDTGFLEYIFDGGNDYFGINNDFNGHNGLSDRSEATRCNEILRDGVNYSTFSGTHTYYYDFIIQALRDYGFKI